MKYKVVSNIKRKGWPTSSKHYKTAHEEADKIEKKADPKVYSKLKKIDNKTPKGQLIGKNSKSGKIEISKKVLVAYRDNVYLHEKAEAKALIRLKNHKHKKRAL